MVNKYYTMDPSIMNGEKIIFSINDAGKIGKSHAK